MKYQILEGTLRDAATAGTRLEDGWCRVAWEDELHPFMRDEGTITAKRGV